MSQNAAIERRYSVMGKSIVHAGCEPIEADLTTGLFDVSPKIRAMFGFSDDAVTATVADLLTRIHPDDLPQYQTMRLAADETGEVSNITIRVVNSQGEVRHIRLTAGIDSLGWAPRPGSAPTSWGSTSEFVRRYC
jgi:hypothetical protein